MMNRHRSALLSALFLAAPLFAQGEIDLRSAAKKGASVWLLQEQKQESTIDMGGQELETAQTTIRTVQVTVKDVDDKGNLVVETKIVRVHGSATMPMGMGDIEFDSADEGKEGDDEDDMGGMSGMMKKAQLAGAGKSFSAKVSPFGKVVELTDGVAEILGDGGMTSPGAMTKTTLTQIVETAFGIVSDKPVAVGGKWQHKQQEAGSRMPVEHKIELTLAKADADSFEIIATGTVEKPAAKEGDDKADDAGSEEEAMAREMMKNMQMKNGKITGTQKISRQDGFVLESSNVMTMDVEMSGPMGEMSMTVKATTSTKRTTAEAATAKKAEEKKAEEPKKDAGK
jgi:hypothetical protein